MRLRSYPSRDTLDRIMASLKGRERQPVIPFSVEILGDLETPVSILRRISSRDGVFLLESVEGGERWGRYSFIGAGTHHHLIVWRQEVEIHYPDGSTHRVNHHGDPLSVLRSFLNGFVVPSDELLTEASLPRFWGGVVGYICYEMVSFFEPVPNLLDPTVPIAHFVLPSDLIIFDNRCHTVTLLSLVLPTPSQSSDAVMGEGLRRLDTLERSLFSDTSRTSLYDLPSSTPPSLHPSVDPEAFRQSVLQAKDYIRQGEIIQVVLSQPFICHHAPDPWLLYRLQRYINPSPYLFFCRLGQTTLVGSSPETMVRLESGLASVRPIAGTRPRGTTEQEDHKLANDLLQDEKERAEHVMLVDLGRNDLGRVAEMGTVQVTEYMVVERYSHVMHLVSHVQAQLKRGLDAWDLFRATFPAGTLTGAPKVRAMQIIAELEGTGRGPYGGAVGYVSFQGNMDMAITIRTAVIHNGSLTVQAGAGIVADSDPERERLETIHKAKAMERALARLPEMTQTARRTP